MARSHTCDKCHIDIDDDKQEYANCQLIIEVAKDNVPLFADSTKRVDFCDHECLVQFVEEMKGE